MPIKYSCISCAKPCKRNQKSIFLFSCPLDAVTKNLFPVTPASCGHISNAPA